MDDLPVHGRAHPDLSRRDVAQLFIKSFERHDVRSVVGFANGGLTDSAFLMKFLRSVNRRGLRRLYGALASANVLDPQPYLSGQFPEIDTSYIEILKDWVRAGHILGNHTYWHSNLSNGNTDLFIKGIEKNEKLLTSLCEHDARLFRYPFLREGTTQPVRDQIRQFLRDGSYKVVPVTVDFADWAWHRSYVRSMHRRSPAALEMMQATYIEVAVLALKASILASRQLFGRDIPHVLLLHLGAFTALNLDKLLETYSQLGVRYVTVDKVMADEVYSAAPNVILPGKGRSFLEQSRIERNEPACLVNRDVFRAQLFASTM